MIIPSTKLKILTVHKLWDLVCPRKYFWRWVLNLEPKRINMNFWYGGVLGEGFENLLMGKSLKQVNKLMQKESLKRTRRHAVSPEDKANLDLNMRLIKAFIAGVVKQKRKDFDYSKMHLNECQVAIKMPLDYTDITYLGTGDGDGTYKNKPCLYELKTAKWVNNDYINRLSFDKQVHGYALGLKEQGRKCASRCTYCIFRKPQKRLKRGQSVDSFVDEIKLDLIARPEFYYILHEWPFGAATLRQVKADIEAAAWRLSLFYQKLSEKELLDPSNWDRQDGQCLYYGACEYLPLCSHLQAWRVYERLYQQRELMYEEEKSELRV